MKIPITLILLFLSTANSFSQLPVFTGETIDKKNVTIPKDILGKYSLLCFASSQKAQPDLESWLDPVYQKYIAKTGLMDDMFDVNIYFIPVLTGTNLAFKTSIKNKFDEHAQADLRPHVIFCSEDGKKILSDLNMQESSVPYFLLLDKDAKIIYRTSGKFTEDKFDAIEDLIE